MTYLRLYVLLGNIPYVLDSLKPFRIALELNCEAGIRIALQETLLSNQAPFTKTMRQRDPRIRPKSANRSRRPGMLPYLSYASMEFGCTEYVVLCNLICLLLFCIDNSTMQVQSNALLIAIISVFACIRQECTHERHLLSERRSEAARLSLPIKRG